MQPTDAASMVGGGRRQHHVYGSRFCSSRATSSRRVWGHTVWSRHFPEPINRRNRRSRQPRWFQNALSIVHRRMRRSQLSAVRKARRRHRPGHVFCATSPGTECAHEVVAIRKSYWGRLFQTKLCIMLLSHECVEARCRQLVSSLFAAPSNLLKRSSGHCCRVTKAIRVATSIFSRDA